MTLCIDGDTGEALRGTGLACRVTSQVRGLGLNPAFCPQLGCWWHPGFPGAVEMSCWCGCLEGAQDGRRPVAAKGFLRRVCLSRKPRYGDSRQ